MIGDTLYKYRCWSNDNHVNILKKNEIYFASPSEFNDPFDCRIPPDLTLLDSDEKLDQFLHITINQAIKSNPTLDYEIEKSKLRHRMKLNPHHEATTLKNLHYSLQDELYGIFSLSCYWDNVLLWSHYSDNHKGFCIGFDLESLKKIPEIGMGQPVRYQEEFPKIDPLSENYSEIIKLEINTKAKDWEYEGEFRLTTLIGSRMKSRVLKIPDDCFKEVIVGLKFPKDQINVIKDITQQKGIKLFQAIGREGKFKIAKIEI